MEYTALNQDAWNRLHSIRMHFNTLHGLHCCIMDYTAAIMLHIIHCIQSGCIGPRCMDSTAYNRDPLRHNAWNPLHSMTLHGIHWIQSPGMESIAFNTDAFYHAEWSTLHSITMHGIHCIPSGWFWPCCITRTAFNLDALGLAAWTPCIQSGSFAPQCMESSSFNDAAWNPLHSIGMLWAMLHKIHCIQTCCMESTALNHAA